MTEPHPHKLSPDTFEAWDFRVTRIPKIPKSTWFGRLMCRIGRHRWFRTGAIQTVIPTGNALLIKRRHQPILCERPGCKARRDEIYDREQVS